MIGTVFWLIANYLSFEAIKVWLHRQFNFTSCLTQPTVSLCSESTHARKASLLRSSSVVVIMQSRMMFAFHNRFCELL